MTGSLTPGPRTSALSFAGRSSRRVLRRASKSTGPRSGGQRAITTGIRSATEGLGIGALAIGNEEPAAAGEILHSGLNSLPLAMTQYGPDGAWAEGPGYWGYATKYNVFLLAALQTSLGTDFGLSDIPGFSLCGMMPIYSTGPLGKSFNYADSGDSAVRAPEMWWLATRFRQPGYAWYARTYCLGGPLDILWYDSSLDMTRPKDLPLDRYFRNSEVVMMRQRLGRRRGRVRGFQGWRQQGQPFALGLGQLHHRRPGRALGVRPWR